MRDKVGSHFLHDIGHSQSIIVAKPPPNHHRLAFHITAWSSHLPMPPSISARVYILFQGHRLFKVLQKGSFLQHYHPEI